MMYIIRSMFLYILVLHISSDKMTSPFSRKHAILMCQCVNIILYQHIYVVWAIKWSTQFVSESGDLRSRQY